MKAMAIFSIYGWLNVDPVNVALGCEHFCIPLGYIRKNGVSRFRRMACAKVRS